MTKLGAIASALLGAAGLALVAGQAAAQTTINWALWDWDKTVYYKPLIEAYQAKHPDVKVDYTDLGSVDYNQMVMTQLTGGGSDLDVITIKDIPGYVQMINTGRLMDLTGDAIAPKDPSIYGGLIEALTVGGKLYSLPMRTDFWIVYYNKDPFDKAGVPYPTNDMTWAQYDELARKITGGFGPDKVYGAHQHVWRSVVELPAITTGERTLIAKDYSFLKPWYERALKLQDDGIARTYASLKTSQTHYSSVWFQGQVGMMPMGTWFVSTQIAKQKTGESTVKNWGVVKYPHPEGAAPGGTAGVVTALAVNVNSKQAEAAKDFAAFVTGPEGAAIFAKTGNIPALRDANVLKTITSTPGFPSDPASAEALVVKNTYLELPVDPKAPEYELVLNRAHDNIMTENVTVDQGIKDMNDGVAAIK